MTQRDIFSILEDGQPFKAEPKVLRRDRVKPGKLENIETKEQKEKTEKIVKKNVRKKKEEESTEIKPDTNFVD